MDAAGGDEPQRQVYLRRFTITWRRQYFMDFLKQFWHPQSAVNREYYVMTQNFLSIKINILLALLTDLLNCWGNLSFSKIVTRYLGSSAHILPSIRPFRDHSSCFCLSLQQFRKFTSTTIFGDDQLANCKMLALLKV